MSGLSRDDLDLPREMSAKQVVEAQRYSPPMRRTNSLRLRMHSIDWGKAGVPNNGDRSSLRLENLKRFRNLSSMSEETLLGIAAERGVKAKADTTAAAAASVAATTPDPIAIAAAAVALPTGSSSAVERLTPRMKRSNSTNSLFIDQTLTNLVDTDSIIESASAVLHNLIADNPGREIPKYKVFVSKSNTATSKPTYEQVKAFMLLIFTRAQLEPECIITAHIYMEKLMKNLAGKLTVGYRNWEPILLACFMLASKILDDLSMINADFSYITRKYNFDLKQVNKMEIALLSALKFDVRVSISRYAQYYFKLRGMHNRTPRAVGAHGASDGTTAPLSVAGAMDLHTLSRSHEQRLKKKIKASRRRFNTIGGSRAETSKAAKLPAASVEQMLVSSRKTKDGADVSS